MALEVVVDERPDVLRVRLAGDLDTLEIARFQQAIAAHDGIALDLHLDLSRVEFIDSAGIYAIVQLAQLVHRQGRRIETHCPASSLVRRAFDTTGLAERVGIHDRPSPVGERAASIQSSRARVQRSRERIDASDSRLERAHVALAASEARVSRTIRTKPENP